MNITSENGPETICLRKCRNLVFFAGKLGALKARGDLIAMTYTILINNGLLKMLNSLMVNNSITWSPDLRNQ